MPYIPLVLTHPNEAPPDAGLHLHQDLPGTLDAYADANKIMAAEYNAAFSRIKSLCAAQRVNDVLVGRAPASPSIQTAKVFRYVQAALNDIHETSQQFPSDLDKTFAAAVAGLRASDLTGAAVTAGSCFFARVQGIVDVASAFLTNTLLGFNSASGSFTTYAGGIHPPVGRCLGGGKAFVDIGGRIRGGTLVAFAADGSLSMALPANVSFSTLKVSGTLEAGRLSAPTGYIGGLTSPNAFLSMISVASGRHFDPSASAALLPSLPAGVTNGTGWGWMEVALKGRTGYVPVKWKT